MPTKLQQLVEEFLTYHRFSMSEFCRIANIEISTLEKILNNQHYVTIFDYGKLAHILNVDTSLILRLSATE